MPQAKGKKRDGAAVEVRPSQAGTEQERSETSDEAREVDAAGRRIEPERLPGAIEAILLTLDKAVTAGRLAEALGLGVEDNPTASVREAVDSLNEEYERSGRSFRIEKVAGGYRVMTLPEFADAVAAFQATRASAKLSRAAIETLAITAYRQPMTRAELEAIRGVACGEVLRTLLEKRLVSIVGRAEEPGRPMLYGTSKRFLELFGLSSVKDLPKVTDLSETAAAIGKSQQAHAEAQSETGEKDSPVDDAREQAGGSSPSADESEDDGPQQTGG